MYERFYQLRNRPFALSPDPDFLYPSDATSIHLDVAEENRPKRPHQGYPTV